jgi:hypothetical protein
LSRVKWREHDDKEVFDVCWVDLNCLNELIYRDEMGSKFFDALQEKSSRDEYGTLLGRLICFYLRQNEGDLVPWSPLTPIQQASLDALNVHLVSQDADSESLQSAFDKVLYELFLWEENDRLIDEMACPVQRFLVCASIDKGGRGFINVREVGRLIAKLIYGIRSCIYKELMKRSQGREVRISVNKELGGLGKYVWDLRQTPFGFLKETMHLASYISADGGTLPQISWLGKDEYTALAIHGKRVELRELGKLSRTLLKKTKTYLDSQVKMGLNIKQWRTFEPADDMWNEGDGYSFISTLKDKDLKGGKALADAFMSNGITRTFFTKGINRGILWHKNNCLTWLKRCKKMCEMLLVLCHLLGGQPARATEMATLRWRNSGSEQRGAYWVNGTMMLLARYSKTRSIVGRDRPIPR